MARAADAGLAGALRRIEDASGGRLGVAVRDTATSRRVLHRAAERFPLCSTFKVLACAAVLTRVQEGRESLDRRIRFTTADLVAHSPVTRPHAGGDGMRLGALCAAAMTESDNTAGNLVLATLGGPSGVTAYARAIGDQVTRLDRTETALNEATPGDERDTTTPEAMAANLDALVLGRRLSSRSRDQFTAWLLACRTGGAMLRAGLPPGWRIGDRTGGSDRGSTNDVAVVWPPGRKPLVVCVYLTETKAGFDASCATIAAVGRAVVDWLPKAAR
jgi:beta-lactamase class A